MVRRSGPPQFTTWALIPQRRRTMSERSVTVWIGRSFPGWFFVVSSFVQHDKTTYTQVFTPFDYCSSPVWLVLLTDPTVVKECSSIVDRHHRLQHIDLPGSRCCLRKRGNHRVSSKVRVWVTQYSQFFFNPFSHFPRSTVRPLVSSSITHSPLPLVIIYRR